MRVVALMDLKYCQANSLGLKEFLHSIMEELLPIRAPSMFAPKAWN